MRATGHPSTSSGQVRLAVIDDDSGFIRVLTKRLEAAGWQFRMQASPLPREELVALRAHALLLDPACLGSSVWEYLASVCEALPDLGVVVCCERTTVTQRVRGLRLGADDWITKPCHPEEVIARLEAVTRRRLRATGPAAAGPVRVGDLELRPDQFQAFVGGRSVELTRREFEVLNLLVEAGGRVLEREEIYSRVWGYAMVRGDRSVDVFVRKLRAKIQGASQAWRYIHTHFGIGYRFEAELVDASMADSAAGEAEGAVDYPRGSPTLDGRLQSAAVGRP